jgi:hypothetical protein
MEVVQFTPEALDEYPDIGTDCPLCEWENAPVDRHGESVDTDPAHAADRNGGHTLAGAQANFQKFLSMYDPSNPEPWMPAPPTHEEVRWKEELVRLYKQILDPFNVSGTGLLGQIESLESELATAAQERADAAEVPIDDSDDDEPEEAAGST